MRIIIIFIIISFFYLCVSICNLIAGSVILCCSIIIPVNSAIIDIPVTNIFIISNACIFKINSSAVYLPPIVFITFKSVIIKVNCSVFYIPPAYILIIGKSRISKINITIGYLKPSIFIRCKTCIIPINCPIDIIMPLTIFSYGKFIVLCCLNLYYTCCSECRCSKH